MPQVPAVSLSAVTPGISGGDVFGSASSSEKIANAPRAGPSSGRQGPSVPKPRSCVTCRTRKVRCDKSSPCSNCRRGNIPCVFPSADKPPRWARRLERITNSAKPAQDAGPDVGHVMERLRKLEDLVKELSGQLEQAHAAADLSGLGPSLADSTGSLNLNHDGAHHVHSYPATNPSNVGTRFGRLVLGDAGQSRYISSGFWSRMNDELDALKVDTEGLPGGDYDSSEDEGSSEKTPPTQELDRNPSGRHAFLFRHNLSSPEPDLREFHPSPTEIPLLYDAFCENINLMAHVLHIPTLEKVVRPLRDGDYSTLTPANEALMFAIYYASVTSMDEEDVMAHFSSSKSDLNFKYRLGLEHALAKADFLNVPDIVLVQAFSIFLCLLRRHDSPRFVWMMTGLVIRMALALGLHHDGSHFANLSPFEVEMRRRVWWAVCLLDARASEDQCIDLAIAPGSFDTRLPLNINDNDIGTETKETPRERESITDMTFFISFISQCEISREMMAVSGKDGTPRLEEQNRLLNKYYETLEKTYLQYSNAEGNIAHWVCVTIARLVVAKMSLIIYFPVLFSYPSEHASDEIRAKLFIAAIEVAEYNHALNSEQSCRQWRWIFQTYTHWYAVVYMLIEAARRPWSPLVERAWVALHSTWLVPAQAADKNVRFWIPLRKLMAKARRHREAELERLRRNPHAVRQLEAEDRYTAQPGSRGPFPGANSADTFRDRWLRLVKLEKGFGGYTQTATQPRGEVTPLPSHNHLTESNLLNLNPFHPYNPNTPISEQGFGSAYAQSNILQGSRLLPLDFRDGDISELGPSATVNQSSQIELGAQLDNSFYGSSTSVPAGFGSGLGAWLWAEADPSVDMFSGMDAGTTDLNVYMDSEVDWNSWVESIKGISWSGN